VDNITKARLIKEAHASLDRIEAILSNIIAATRSNLKKAA
jgi:hypothetical protein